MTWLNIISSSSLGLFILMKQTEGRALRNGNDEEQSLPLLTESTGLEHLEPGSIIHIEPTDTDKHTQVDAGVIGRDVHPDSETIIMVQSPAVEIFAVCVVIISPLGPVHKYA